jgi:3-methyladenine DNA glycosylase/8-oxoguanine DNA glycosylase
MFLIFNLGRPDVLPVHDLGVRRGFQVAYRKRSLPTPEQLAQHGGRWAPHRTLAARYLWRAADSAANPNW